MLCANGSTRRSLKGYAARLPMEGMVVGAAGRCEADDVCRYVVRLDRILRILARRIAPAADLDIEFAMILLGSAVIPGKHSKHGRGLELREVACQETVLAVAEAARQPHFGVRPML